MKLQIFHDSLAIVYDYSIFQKQIHMVAFLNGCQLLLKHTSIKSYLLLVPKDNMVHSIHRLRSPNAVYVLDFSTVDSSFIFFNSDRHIFQLLKDNKCCTLVDICFMKQMRILGNAIHVNQKLGHK